MWGEGRNLRYEEGVVSPIEKNSSRPGRLGSEKAPFCLEAYK